jgi:hypothetical protein
MKIKFEAVMLYLLSGGASFAAEKEGFAVKYYGGTIADLKTGTDFRINLSDATITLTKRMKA